MQTFCFGQKYRLKQSCNKLLIIDRITQVMKAMNDELLLSFSNKSLRTRSFPSPSVKLALIISCIAYGPIDMSHSKKFPRILRTEIDNRHSVAEWCCRWFDRCHVISAPLRDSTNRHSFAYPAKKRDSIVCSRVSRDLPGTTSLDLVMGHSCARARL